MPLVIQLVRAELGSIPRITFRGIIITFPREWSEDAVIDFRSEEGQVFSLIPCDDTGGGLLSQRGPGFDVGWLSFHRQSSLFPTEMCGILLLGMQSFIRFMSSNLFLVLPNSAPLTAVSSKVAGVRESLSSRRIILHRHPISAVPHTTLQEPIRGNTSESSSQSVRTASPLIWGTCINSLEYT